MDEFKVGDKVILAYESKFGTGRKAVANGPIVHIDDTAIEVAVGRVEVAVVWDDVFSLRLA